jgi:uncharacterized membrane protein
VFFSSWLGSWMLALGEWIIKRLPLVKHIYSASKQVREDRVGGCAPSHKGALEATVGWFRQPAAGEGKGLCA